jgi:hypothetical protein
MASISLPGQLVRTRLFALGVPWRFTVTLDGATVLFLRSRAGADPVTCLWALDLDSPPTPPGRQPDLRICATGRRQPARTGSAVSSATAASVPGTTAGSQPYGIIAVPCAPPAVRAAP